MKKLLIVISTMFLMSSVFAQKDNKEPVMESISLKVYYLAKKDEADPHKITGLTDGPFNSVEQAISAGNSKYRWLISEYVVISTEQQFKVESSQLHSNSM